MGWMMASPKRNSHGVYVTRLTVPEDLRNVVGKRELKRSLNTKNEREARLNHPIVLTEFQAILETARRKKETEFKLTNAVIESIAFQWKQSVIKRLGAAPKAENPYLIQHCGLIEENNIPVTMLLDDISHLNPTSKQLTKKYQQLENILQELFEPYLDKYQIEPDINLIQYKKFLIHFANAYINLTSFALQKKSTDLKFESYELEIPKYQIGYVEDDLTFSALWEQYKDALYRRNPDGAKKRLNDYSTAVNRFIEKFPKKVIGSFTKRDIAEFRTILECLPSRPKSNIKKLPLSEQIVKAKEQNLPLIGQSNIRKQILAISSVFNYGEQQGLIKDNPVKGVISDIKKIIPNSDENKGYTQEELQKLFTSKLFTENYTPQKADYGKAIYWIPLLLAYTGARAEEIAQLYIADIHLNENIPYIRFSDERPDQSLKTSEKRTVPIHSHLIELGFIEYVQEQDELEKLFPKLQQNNVGQYHVNIAKWFGKYLKAEVMINRKELKPFHGFRHSFITACRHYDVVEAIQDAITGHSSQRMGRQYGTITLDKKREAIEKIPRWF